jgi:hypothetical protein
LKNCGQENSYSSNLHNFKEKIEQFKELIYSNLKIETCLREKKCQNFLSFTLSFKLFRSFQKCSS